MGVSPRNVKTERAVKAASPELHEQVKAGKLSVNAAKKKVEAKPTPEASRPAADKPAADKPADVADDGHGRFNISKVGPRLATLGKAERNKALAEIIIAAMKLDAPTAATKREVEREAISAMEQVDAKFTAWIKKARKATAADDANLKDIGRSLTAAFNRAR